MHRPAPFGRYPRSQIPDPSLQSSVFSLRFHLFRQCLHQYSQPYYPYDVCFDGTILLLKMSFHSRNSCSFITSFSCLVGAVLVVLLFVTIVFQNGNGSTFPLFSEQIIGTAIRGMYSMPLSSLETNATRHLIPFDATSSIINNDEKWLDNQGVEIKAARAATLSRHKIDGFWYMVGSESNETWVCGGHRETKNLSAAYIN